MNVQRFIENYGVISGRFDTVNDRVVGHELDDQPPVSSDKQHALLIQKQLRTIKRFNGSGDAESWLKYIIKKFDSLGLSHDEWNDLIFYILAGDAIIWYAREEEKMPTFTCFVREFLQHYGRKQINELSLSTLSTLISTQVNSQEIPISEQLMADLRLHVICNVLQDLPKFAGEKCDSVLLCLSEFQEATRVYDLSDDEKLFYLPICLEGNARYWFYDGGEIFTTWSLFVQRFIQIFKSSSDIIPPFDQFCSSKQAMNSNKNNAVFVAQSQFTIDPLIDQQDIVTSCNAVEEDILVIGEHGGVDFMLDESQESRGIQGVLLSTETTSNIVTEDIRVMVEAVEAVEAEFTLDEPQQAAEIDRVILSIDEEMFVAAKLDFSITEMYQRNNSVTSDQRSFDILYWQKHIVMDSRIQVDPELQISYDTQRIYCNTFIAVWFENRPFDPGGSGEKYLPFSGCV